MISSEKNILQTNFDGEYISYKKIPDAKNCPALKKKKRSLMLHRYMSLYVWGKPKPNHPYSPPCPPPQKSKGPFLRIANTGSDSVYKETDLFV